MKETDRMHDVRRRLAGCSPTLESLLTIAAITALASACAPDAPPASTEPPETQVEILRPITLTQNALLPEADARLMDVEIFRDRLVFLYSSAPSDPPSVDDVVSGVLHGGYLRRVTGIISNTGTRIEVATTNAYLTELIGDGHFRVRFDPRDGDRSFRPVTEDGVGVTTGALEGGFSLLPTDLGETPCMGSTGGSVTIDPTLDMDVDVDLEMDIRWSTRWLVVPVGELHSAHFILEGSIEAGVSIESSSNVSVECEWDLLERYGSRVPKREWATTIPVGPVPVVITHTIQPTLTFTVGGEIATGASTASYTGRIGVRAGAEYADGGWSPVWQPSRSGSVNLTAEERGTLTISAGASAGIQYEAKIYDTVGPSVSLGPSVSAEFVVEGDLCTWSAEAKAGVDLELGVSLEVPVVDITLAEFSASQTLVEGTIAMREGTFPWCEDASMPMPDGGTVTPRDGGGGMTGSDAGSDPCSTAGSTCETCNARAGCGLCAATGQCMRDSRRSECDPTQWRDSISECEVCSGHGDCSSCVGDAFCGWCGSTGTCMTATTGGGAPMPCADWNYGRIFECM